MAYSIEIREEVLKKLSSGCSIKMVSSEFGISTATICRWKIAKEQENNEVAIENKIINTRVDDIPSQVEEVFKPLEDSKNMEDVETKSIVDISSLSHEISRLSKLGRLQEALELCDHSLGATNPMIQHQKVTILVKLARNEAEENQILKLLREAVSICNENNRKKYFILLKEKIGRLFPTLLTTIEQEIMDSKSETLESSRNVKDTIRMITAKIYCDFITEEEIKNSDIDSWTKNILLIAYYEKTNRATKLFLAKKLKEENQGDQQKIKFLNQLIERFSSKKNNYFNLVTYTNYLHCSLDYTLVKKLEEEKKFAQKEMAKSKIVAQEKTIISMEEKVKEERRPEKEKAPKKMISVVGQRVTPRYQQANPSNNAVNDEQELLIKDVFANEVFELGKQIYIQMYDPENRMRGMDAWDRLEALKMKSANDIWALRSMINLIDRINLKEPGFIKTNDERNVELIKKAKEKQKSKKL